MIRYASVVQARMESKVMPGDTQHDDYLKQALWFTSARIDAMTDFEFAPRVITKKLHARGLHIDDELDVIDLPAPLLEPVLVTINNGSTLVLNTDYEFYPTDGYPVTQLRRLGGHSWSEYGETWINAISIKALWGYRQRYDLEGWTSSGGKNSVALTPTGTEITLVSGSIDGRDGLYRTPRFSAGQMIRMLSELMIILETDAAGASPDKLIVKRAVNGSSAPVADYPIDTAIDIFEPDPIIQRACLRWTGYLYVRRGAYESLKTDGATVVQFPPDAPEEVLNILDERRSFGWIAV
jgi:hypothetical protein